LPKLNANIQFLFNEHDVLSRFEEASNFGFNAVELQSPYKFDPAYIKNILDDFNFSSITDVGVGNFTLNFTTSMGDANYSAVASTRHADAVSMAVCPTVDTRTTSTYKIYTVTAAAVAYDPVSDGISTIVFGDSA